MDLDIRYVAGLFDGEGWITICVMPFGSMGTGHRYTKDYVRYQLFVGIGMSYYPLIKKLQDQFGGILNRNDSAHKKSTKNRICYNWRLGSNQAAEFLSQILPYLQVKDEEAKLAIEFQQHMRNHVNDFRYRKHLRPQLYAYRQGVVERLKTFKKRSFDVPNGSDPSSEAA
jgi:hypothetical protein